MQSLMRSSTISTALRCILLLLILFPSGTEAQISKSCKIVPAENYTCDIIVTITDAFNRQKSLDVEFSIWEEKDVTHPLYATDIPKEWDKLVLRPLIPDDRVRVFDRLKKESRKLEESCFKNGRIVMHRDNITNSFILRVPRDLLDYHRQLPEGFLAKKEKGYWAVRSFVKITLKAEGKQSENVLDVLPYIYYFGNGPLRELPNPILTYKIVPWNGIGDEGYYIEVNIKRPDMLPIPFEVRFSGWQEQDCFNPISRVVGDYGVDIDWNKLKRIYVDVGKEMNPEPIGGAYADPDRYTVEPYYSVTRNNTQPFKVKFSNFAFTPQLDGDVTEYMKAKKVKEFEAYAFLKVDAYDMFGTPVALATNAPPVSVSRWTDDTVEHSEEDVDLIINPNTIIIGKFTEHYPPRTPDIPTTPDSTRESEKCPPHDYVFNRYIINGPAEVQENASVEQPSGHVHNYALSEMDISEEPPQPRYVVVKPAKTADLMIAGFEYHLVKQDGDSIEGRYILKDAITRQKWVSLVPEDSRGYSLTDTTIIKNLTEQDVLTFCESLNKKCKENGIDYEFFYNEELAPRLLEAYSTKQEPDDRLVRVGTRYVVKTTRIYDCCCGKVEKQYSTSVRHLNSDFAYKMHKKRLERERADINSDVTPCDDEPVIVEGKKHYTVTVETEQICKKCKDTKILQGSRESRSFATYKEAEEWINKKKK